MTIENSAIESVEKILSEVILEIANDTDQQKLFKMSATEIKNFLNLVQVTDTGIDLSPNFQSPGWSENHDELPDINLSDMGTNTDVIKHELRHALHFFSCVKLFEDNKFSQKAFEHFKNEIIADKDFIKWIINNVNNFGKKNLQTAIELIKNDYNKQDVEKLAKILGAITYQHAYFVDPAICEAIASYEDSGAFLNISHFLNRNFGLMLPGNQPLEGYKNLKMQKKIIDANPIKMALMITKKKYAEQKDTYWNS